jgi:hypothetical protein
VKISITSFTWLFPICFWAWNFTIFCLGLYNKQNITRWLALVRKILFSALEDKSHIYYSRVISSIISFIWMKCNFCFRVHNSQRWETYVASYDVALIPKLWHFWKSIELFDGRVVKLSCGRARHFVQMSRSVFLPLANGPIQRGRR